MKLALLTAAALCLALALDVHGQVVSNQPVFLCNQKGQCVPFVAAAQASFAIPVIIVNSATATATATQTPTATPT